MYEILSITVKTRTTPPVTNMYHILVIQSSSSLSYFSSRFLLFETRFSGSNNGSSELIFSELLLCYKDSIIAAFVGLSISAL